MKTRTIFKISGVLVIFMIGLIFLFYARTNHDFAKAEDAYSHGDFETAELFYEKGIGGFPGQFPHGCSLETGRFIHLCLRLHPIGEGSR